MSSRLDDFREAYGQSGALLKSALAGGILVPLLDLALDFGPPWPGRAVSILTTIGELVVVSMTFDRFAKASVARKKRAMVFAVIILVVSLVAYIALTSELTFEHPRGGRMVGGFVLRPEVARVIDPGSPVEDTLRDSGWNPAQVWTSGSLTVARLSLLATWFAFFLSFAAYLMLFILRSAPARKEKTRTTPTSKPAPDSTR